MQTLTKMLELYYTFTLANKKSLTEYLNEIL